MSDETNPETRPEAEQKSQTPGERLAAAKAAKAARKAAERGREADLREDRALKSAEAAKDWLGDHMKSIGIGFVAIGLIALGAWVISSAMKSSNQDAGSALWSAFDDAESEAPTEQKIAALSEVSKKYRDRNAGAWATLTEASLSLKSGNNEAAAKGFRDVIGATKDEALAALALEGLSVALLNSGDNDGALTELGALQKKDARFAPIALYQQAMLLDQTGKPDDALEKLKAARALLDAENAIGLPYTESRMDALQARLDPSFQKAPAFDAEAIRQMLKAQGQ